MVSKIKKENCKGCGGWGYRVAQWPNDGMPLLRLTCHYCSSKSQNLAGVKFPPARFYYWEQTEQGESPKYEQA